MCLKKWLVRFLLGRGMSKLQELLGKLLRHGLTMAGGAMLMSGHITDQDMSVLQGAVVVVVGILMSFARTWFASFAAKYLT